MAYNITALIPKGRNARIAGRLLSWGEKAISGFKFLHNFLKAHLTLSETSSKNWITVPVTPCMIAEICNRGNP
jgi:hypothetical protein